MAMAWRPRRVAMFREAVGTLAQSNSTKFGVRGYCAPSADCRRRATRHEVKTPRHRASRVPPTGGHGPEGSSPNRLGANLRAGSLRGGTTPGPPTAPLRFPRRRAKNEAPSGAR